MLFIIVGTVLTNEINCIISINDTMAYYNKPHLHNSTKIFLLDICQNCVSVFVDWQPGLLSMSFEDHSSSIYNMQVPRSCGQGKKALECGSVWSWLKCLLKTIPQRKESTRVWHDYCGMNWPRQQISLFFWRDFEGLEIKNKKNCHHLCDMKKASMPKSPYFRPKGGYRPTNYAGT